MVDVDDDLLDDVRMELGDTDDVLDEDMIAYHTRKAKRKIVRTVGQSADDGAIRDAVALKAAIRFITRDKDTFLEAKEGSEFTKRWDISEYLEMLKSEYDEAIEDAHGNWTVTESRHGTHVTR